MSIMQETDKIEVPAGTTAKGTELVITNTPQGFYKIEARGPGAPPLVTSQLFTSLAFAKRALENWRRSNAAAFAKEELKNRIVNEPSHKQQRKLEAMKLKNGDLSVPEEEE